MTIYAIAKESDVTLIDKRVREEVMWQLFGIDTTPQETIDYWDE